MPTKTIRKGLAGEEDLSRGSGTFSRGTSSGGTQTISKLNLTSFANVGTYTAADTTPSVADTEVLPIANSGAISITTFDDGTAGQRIILQFADANTTIVHGATVKLSGGSNFTSTANDTMTLVLVSSVWYEVARSVNG